MAVVVVVVVPAAVLDIVAELVNTKYSTIDQCHWYVSVSRTQGNKKTIQYRIQPLVQCQKGHHQRNGQQSPPIYFHVWIVRVNMTLMDF